MQCSQSNTCFRAIIKSYVGYDFGKLYFYKKKNFPTYNIILYLYLVHFSKFRFKEARRDKKQLNYHFPLKKSTEIL